MAAIVTGATFANPDGIGPGDEMAKMPNAPRTLSTGGGSLEAPRRRTGGVVNDNSRNQGCVLFREALKQVSDIPGSLSEDTVFRIAKAMEKAVFDEFSDSGRLYRTMINTSSSAVKNTECVGKYFILLYVSSEESESGLENWSSLFKSCFSYPTGRFNTERAAALSASSNTKNAEFPSRTPTAIDASSPSVTIRLTSFETTTQQGVLNTENSYNPQYAEQHNTVPCESISNKDALKNSLPGSSNNLFDNPSNISDSLINSGAITQNITDTNNQEKNYATPFDLKSSQLPQKQGLFEVAKNIVETEHYSTTEVHSDNTINCSNYQNQQTIPVLQKHNQTSNCISSDNLEVETVYNIGDINGENTKGVCNEIQFSTVSNEGNYLIEGQPSYQTSVSVESKHSIVNNQAGLPPLPHRSISYIQGGSLQDSNMEHTNRNGALPENTGLRLPRRRRMSSAAGVCSDVMSVNSYNSEVPLSAQKSLDLLNSIPGYSTIAESFSRNGEQIPNWLRSLRAQQDFALSRGNRRRCRRTGGGSSAASSTSRFHTYIGDAHSEIEGHDNETAITRVIPTNSNLISNASYNEGSNQQSSSRLHYSNSLHTISNNYTLEKPISKMLRKETSVHSSQSIVDNTFQVDNCNLSNETTKQIYSSEYPFNAPVSITTQTQQALHNSSCGAHSESGYMNMCVEQQDNSKSIICETTVDLEQTSIQQDYMTTETVHTAPVSPLKPHYPQHLTSTIQTDIQSSIVIPPVVNYSNPSCLLSLHIKDDLDLQNKSPIYVSRYEEQIETVYNNVPQQQATHIIQGITADKCSERQSDTNNENKHLLLETLESEELLKNKIRNTNQASSFQDLMDKANCHDQCGLLHDHEPHTAVISDILSFSIPNETISYDEQLATLSHNAGTSLEATTDLAGTDSTRAFSPDNTPAPQLSPVTDNATMMPMSEVVKLYTSHAISVKKLRELLSVLSNSLTQLVEDRIRDAATIEKATTILPRVMKIWETATDNLQKEEEKLITELEQQFSTAISHRHRIATETFKEFQDNAERAVNEKGTIIHDKIKMLRNMFIDLIPHQSYESSLSDFSKTFEELQARAESLNRNIEQFKIQCYHQTETKSNVNSFCLGHEGKSLRQELWDKHQEYKTNLEKELLSSIHRNTTLDGIVERTTTLLSNSPRGLFTEEQMKSDFQKLNTRLHQLTTDNTCNDSVISDNDEQLLDSCNTLFDITYSDKQPSHINDYENIQDHTMSHSQYNSPKNRLPINRSIIPIHSTDVSQIYHHLKKEHQPNNTHECSSQYITQKPAKECHHYLTNSPKHILSSQSSLLHIQDTGTTQQLQQENLNQIINPISQTLPPQNIPLAFPVNLTQQSQGSISDLKEIIETTQQPIFKLSSTDTLDHAVSHSSMHKLLHESPQQKQSILHEAHNIQSQNDPSICSEPSKTSYQHLPPLDSTDNHLNLSNQISYQQSSNIMPIEQNNLKPIRQPHDPLSDSVADPAHAAFEPNGLVLSQPYPTHSKQTPYTLFPPANSQDIRELEEFFDQQLGDTTMHGDKLPTLQNTIHPVVNNLAVAQTANQQAYPNQGQDLSHSIISKSQFSLPHEDQHPGSFLSYPQQDKQFSGQQQLPLVPQYDNETRFSSYPQKAEETLYSQHSQNPSPLYSQPPQKPESVVYSQYPQDGGSVYSQPPKETGIVYPQPPKETGTVYSQQPPQETRSVYSQQPQETGTFYSQQPQESGIGYPQSSQETGTVYSQYPQDGGSVYSQPPKETGTVYPQPPKETGTVYSQQPPQETRSVYSQQPQETGTFYSQQPQESGIGYPQSSQETGTVYSQYPQDGGSVYSQPPKETGTVYPQPPKETGTVFSQYPQDGGSVYSQQPPQETRSVYSQQPQETGTFYSQQPQETGIGYSDTSQETGSVYSQYPQDGGSVYSQPPQETGTVVYSQSPQEGGSVQLPLPQEARTIYPQYPQDSGRSSVYLQHPQQPRGGVYSEYCLESKPGYTQHPQEGGYIYSQYNTTQDQVMLRPLQQQTPDVSLPHQESEMFFQQSQQGHLTSEQLPEAPVFLPYHRDKPILSQFKEETQVYNPQPYNSALCFPISEQRQINSQHGELPVSNQQHPGKQQSQGNSSERLIIIQQPLCEVQTNDSVRVSNEFATNLIGHSHYGTEDTWPIEEGQPPVLTSSDINCVKVPEPVSKNITTAENSNSNTMEIVPTAPPPPLKNIADLFSETEDEFDCLFHAS